MYYKDFDKWNGVKKRIEQEDRQVNIRAGEIRWVAFGVNVGSEIDGKGESFTRPALIVHVVGSSLALVVPMSSKRKEVAGYVPFMWKEITMSLCIQQTRIISQKRVLSRKGKIPTHRLQEIKNMVGQFFALTKPSDR